jgi:chemotaxis signal transduction protein
MVHTLGEFRNLDESAGVAAASETGSRAVRSDGILSVAWAGNGQWLALATHQGILEFREATARAQRRRVEAHGHRIPAIAFSPSGRFLASASYDRTARLWDPNTGACLATLRGHELGLTAIAWDKTGTFLATAAWDGSVRVWEAASGSQRRLIHAHLGGVTAVAFTPDGQRLATAGRDGAVRLWLWNTTDGAALRSQALSSHALLALDATGDGERLAFAGEDRSITICSAGSLRSLARCVSPAPGIRALAYHPGGRRLASADADGQVRLWDTHTGRALAALPCSGATVHGLAFSPDGTRLLAGAADGTARIFRLADGPLEIISPPADESLPPDANSVPDESLEEALVQPPLCLQGSKDLHVIFSLDGRECALPARSVVGITRCPELIAAGGHPSWVRGTIRLRGLEHRVIDLASNPQNGGPGQVVAVRGNDPAIVFVLVERLSGLRAITLDEDTPPASFSTSVTGVSCRAGRDSHGRSVLVLDLTPLLAPPNALLTTS